MQFLFVARLRQYWPTSSSRWKPRCELPPRHPRAAPGRGRGAGGRGRGRGPARSSIDAEWDLERLIDDFVFLCFLVGNDFLPHLPSLSIREGGLDLLLVIYAQLLPRLGGYLTHDGNVQLPRFERFAKALGRIEGDILVRRAARERNEAAQAQEKQAQAHAKGGGRADRAAKPASAPFESPLGDAAELAALAADAVAEDADGAVPLCAPAASRAASASPSDAGDETAQLKAAVKERVEADNRRRASDFEQAHGAVSATLCRGEGRQRPPALGSREHRHGVLPVEATALARARRRRRRRDGRRGRGDRRGGGERARRASTCAACAG